MNIGLVAHDAKKKLMQNFCIAYRGILAKNTLYATGTTGRLIEEATNLRVHKFLSGHLGGMQQLGAMIESNDFHQKSFVNLKLSPQMISFQRIQLDFLISDYMIHLSLSIHHRNC